jgi:RNA polymerase sigma-70 factor (ECF subfamily)
MNSSDSDTNKLLLRAAEGDTAARDELLTRHRPRLRRMIGIWMDARLASRVDPSDVVQDALTTATQRLGEYLRDPPVSFYPWLRRIAWNCLVDTHRTHLLAEKRSVFREQRFLPNDGSSIQLAEHFLAQGTGPLRRLLREELRVQVRTIMRQLPQADQEILVLKHLEQVSTCESAQVLGISEAAAKQRHVRAVRRLREILKTIDFPTDS